MLALCVWAAGAPASVFGDAVPAAESVGLETPFEMTRALRSSRLRGVKPGVVARLFGAPEAGELPIQTLAVPCAPGPEDRVRVAVLVEVDGAAFLSYNQARTARVEVFIYALAEDGGVVDHLAEVFAVDVEESGETIFQSGLKFFGGLELPAGRHELRVLVRNDGSGAFGSQRTELAVRAPDAPPAQPIFSDPGGRDPWLWVRSSTLTFGGELEYPFVFDGEAIRPAARAVLTAGRTVTAYAFTDRGMGAPAEARLSIEFSPAVPGHAADAGAQERIVAMAEVSARAVGGNADGWTSAALTFVAPKVEPGLYWARLVAGGPNGVRSARTPVALLGAATREQDLLWSDLRWLLEGVPGRVPTEPQADGEGELSEAPKRVGRSVRRLAQRYREALAVGSSGSYDRMRSAVFELESEVLQGGSRQTAIRLREAELVVAARLGSRDAEALVPLLRLHAELGEQYRSRRIFSLVAHSRAVVELLAERYAEAGGEPPITASALVSQAGHQQDAGLLASSRRLFFRALHHDSESASALLGLAVSFEKLAEYGSAAEYLELLAARDPGDDEAKLRLAVNQARLGRLRRAREVLEEMVDDDGRTWASEVAVEELARIDLTAGDLSGAKELLARGLDRFPRAAGIRFMLAHVCDRLGEVDRSLKLVADIAASSDDLPSARRRYDEWPLRLLQADRRRLEEAAQAAASRLGSALRETVGD